MSWLDKDFKYLNAEASRKPGYLAKRFKIYERQRREERERKNADELERISKVRTMKAGVKQ